MSRLRDRPLSKCGRKSMPIREAKWAWIRLLMGVDCFVYSSFVLTTVSSFVKVANETMCRPIRGLTEAKGYSTSKHTLATFGGAGGQHACEIARLLGINKILIHRYSSILSAYGLALADRYGLDSCE
jgi:5-oxoprolinase (ATP-hydrolysing)